MKIFKEVPNIKFMNKRKIGFICSGILILIGIILFFTRGFNLSVEFTGGTNIQVSFNKNVTMADLRGALSRVGFGKATIQQLGQGENKFFVKISDIEIKGKAAKPGVEAEQSQFEITRVIESALMSPEEKSLGATKLDLNNASENQITDFLVSKKVIRESAEDTAKKVIELRQEKSSGLIDSIAELEKKGLKSQGLAAIKEYTYLGSFTFLGVEVVGPQVGEDMRGKVTLATIWALIGMLIYIAIRFKFIYGVSGLLTLVHDVLTTLSAILVFQVEVNLSVIAALLTIVGYSINDTIVVFDRIRDNLPIMKNESAEKILDLSINQTLSRTIFTSGTTLLTVVALFFFGGEVIHPFSFTLLFGITIGTYSSIFQSSAYLMVWEDKFLKRKKK